MTETKCYVVATRRGLRGIVATALKKASGIVTICDGVANPDLVLIESADDIDVLRAKFGDDYFVEPEVEYWVQK